MRAAQHIKYDKNNISVDINDIDMPRISPSQVLVKVSAAGVNPLDNLISTGAVAMIMPLKLPQTAGNELVGYVEEVGSLVRNFKVGDRVYGRLPLNSIGAFAQYAAVDEQALALVPEYLTDIEAAAVPLTSLTIMQALELMNIEAGKTIFISGGTGSVGAMAIPIAKAKGLHVITNGNGSSADRVLSLGADRFIDYKTEDYEKTVSDVDYVLDTLGGEETEKQMRIMKAGGHIVSLRAMPNGEFARRMNFPLYKRILLTIAGHSYDVMARKYGVHYHFINVQSNGAQLEEVSKILESKEISPSIDTVFSFEQVNDALAKVARGGSKGKTVLSF